MKPGTWCFSTSEVGLGLESTLDAGGNGRFRPETPPFMKTIFPSPRLGQRTSNSVNEVSFRVSLVSRSDRQRFRVFSRSDVKLSLIHI